MKNFTTAEIRDLLNKVYREEISFSRMVEILNERVSESEVREFKEGDFLHSDWKNENLTLICKKQKGNKIYYHVCKSNSYGVSIDNKYWRNEGDFRHATEAEKQELLDALVKEGKRWNAEKLCVEDIPKELKKGDLAIFWDNDKKIALIKSYDRSIGSEDEYFRHKDQNGYKFRNAVKFESVEQYEKLIKGEI